MEEIREDLARTNHRLEYLENKKVIIENRKIESYRQLELNRPYLEAQ
jgi:hypothetical protein